MKRNISKSISNIKRYQDIIRVFIKYGFSDIVNKITMLPRRHLLSKKGANVKVLSSAARLRMAFEELGATFIKLGQMLSLRTDFIPAEYAAEFSKLQDSVKEDKFEQIRSVLVEELGKPIYEIFLSFDETPIAAASIAQVHKARLKNGKLVAVKILHPGVAKKIESDIEILKNLARLVETHIPESKLYNPVEIVKEFGKTIKKEFNLIHEGHNIDSFRNYLQDDTKIKIPVVYWEYTTESILVTEFINGIKLSDIQHNKAFVIDPKQVTMNAANSLMRQVFELGIFHADPHPGNIFVLPGNVVALIDFGNVGILDEDMRNSLIEIINGIVEKDYHRIAKVLINIGSINEQANIYELKTDLMEFLDFYYRIPLNKISLSKLINEFLELIRAHQIKLPPNLMIMIRTLAISETVARELYPQFNLTELLIPFTKKAYFNKWNPTSTYRELMRTAGDSFDLIRKLPDNLQSIFYKLSNDKFTISLNHNGLEEFTRRIDCSSNRLSFSIIIASLIIGSSIIMYLGKGNLPFDYPVIGIGGFALASVLGIWLLIRVMKSGKF